MIEKIRIFIANTFVFIFSHFPIKNTLVFESNPEFTCNTYAIWDYLVNKKHIDYKYKIIWIVKDRNQYKNSELKNTDYVNFISNTKSLKDKLKYYYIIGTSKGLIYGNRFLGKHRKNQLSFCLQHGMPLKKSNGGYCIHNDCDYALCVSEFFADNYEKDFDVSKDKMFFGGFPRNDYLYGKRDIKKELGLDKYDKIFIWMPTYRKHTHSNMNSFNIEGSQTGIPTINTNDEIRKLDKWLCENNCLLLLKPHPIQKIDVEIKKELTNLKVIDNDTLKDWGVQLYELLGKTDALITDYSSVYYDYILCDKPIGLTADDLDEYIKARGFVYDNPRDILKGVEINNNDELIDFILSVKNGEDKFREERNKLKDKMHKIQSADSARIIGDFIIERLNNL